MFTTRTPGVYPLPIQLQPPTIRTAQSGLPVFIGYTEWASNEKGESLVQEVQRISSLAEYERFYGYAPFLPLTAKLGSDGQINSVSVNEPGAVDAPPVHRAEYRMSYALQAFFANGGQDCYVFSIAEGYPEAGQESNTDAYFHLTQSEAALNRLQQIQEVDLLVLPDLSLLNNSSYQQVVMAVLANCEQRMDRVALFDLKANQLPDDIAPVANFRNISGTIGLAYGAAYYPMLMGSEEIRFRPIDLMIEHQLIDGNSGLPCPPFNYQQLLDFLQIERSSRSATAAPELADEATALFAILVDRLNNTAIRQANNARDKGELYDQLDQLIHPVFQTDLATAIATIRPLVPAAAYAAGVIAKTDRERGPWKAPANVALLETSGSTNFFSEQEQADFNVHPSGKSINLIRDIHGQGLSIWGARTLAGNDNEWRYLSSRRYFIYVEKAIAKALDQYTFANNDSATWSRIRVSIESLLLQHWRAGALLGAKPQEAFQVRADRGLTMTEEDILAGRLLVEIALAVSRPAEFILIRFSRQL